MDNLFFKHIFKDGIKVFIFGAGERGRKSAGVLHDFEVLCGGFIDNDTVKQGTFIDGIYVYSLEDGLKEYKKDDIILISMTDSDEIYKELKEKYNNVYPTEYVDMLMRLTYIECEKYGYHRVETMGHFSSPYPNLKECMYGGKITEASGINYNMDKQKEVLQNILGLVEPFDDKDVLNNKRRYYVNSTYNITDAMVLYGMIKLIAPKNIIEIGSGFSSAVMLDVNEYIFNNEIQLHFIEPYPQRLRKILKDTDCINLEEKNLQDVKPEIFDKLMDGDILFVDSSHMAKRGSDVNRILFEILPRLKSGVYIHFHDIMRDFEYPLEWLSKGWVWNESYLIRAFLMNNCQYEMIFFCDIWNEKINQVGIFENKVNGGSFWIRKL